MLYMPNGQPVGTSALVTPQGTPAVAPKPASTPRARAGYNQRITLLVGACPKQPGSKAAARWALYRNGQTVGEFLAAARAAGHTHPASDVAYNLAHNYIRVS